jgi:thiamine biosynthesis lipoprotein
MPWSIRRSGGAPLELTDGALATSEGAGCILGSGGAAHHLFDPRTGRSASHWRRMIIHHDSAAVADALSTTLYVASHDDINAILRRIEGVTAWATDNEGREYRFDSPTRASL